MSGNAGCRCPRTRRQRAGAEADRGEAAGGARDEATVTDCRVDLPLTRYRSTHEPRRHALVVHAVHALVRADGVHRRGPGVVPVVMAARQDAAASVADGGARGG